MRFTYYDFFAGGGMAGLGLGPAWQCIFANEIDDKKAASYRANHDGGKELLVKDVAEVSQNEVPGQADLLWASFPCQDFSLAGKGAGLAGNRSGTFKPFWKLVEGLHRSGRPPKIVALENVYGVLTSNGGEDFCVLSAALSNLGYRFGALVVDAVHFLPQSRPRFFMVGIHNDAPAGLDSVTDQPSGSWHPAALIGAHRQLPQSVSKNWIWLNPPIPSPRNTNISSIVEMEPSGVGWHSADQTRHLLGMMTEHNRNKVIAAQRSGSRTVGTVYKRTRVDGSGRKHQRAEVRFDGIAGCLRTPAGGSSRQTIIVVDGQNIRSRLLSAREAASLMGLPQDYILPERYNDAYKLAGDGVAVPVVRHLAQSIFEPVLDRTLVGLAA